MVLFTVVIPTYNRANLIGQTIHSVLKQSYFNFELIIVDDGSTDNTTEIVQPFLKDARVLYLKIKNSERGAARNFGVNKSKGDYITFLDSDDIFLSNHLQIAVEKITHNNSPEVFHLAYETLHQNGKIISPSPLPSPVNDKLIEGNFLSCMGVFLRRDVAMNNLFDEDRQLSGSEDFELWMRLAARFPILTFPDITSRLINHDDRSVINTDGIKLVTRIRLLEEKLQRNTYFNQRFSSQLNVFKSFNALYLALHLAILGEKLMACKKLLYAAQQNFKVMISYRFAVVVKKIIFR